MADRVVKVSLVAQVSNYVAGMEQARKSTAGVGTEAEKAKAKFEAQSQAMTQVGTGLLAVGALAAAGVGLAIKKFADFDQAMSNVKAATQESAENMSLLRDAALDAGARTVFSATEAANAIEELGKAGLSTSDILNGGLDGALDLASAGQLGVAEAAGIAATAMKTFNLRGSDMSHVADLLAAGAGKAMGDVGDLSLALSQAGLVANSTGLSIEETTGALAAFASKGLLGSDAGTAFKSMLQRLTPQSAEAQKAMDDLGISAYDAGGNFIGMEAFAGNLQDGLKNLTVEQRQAALATIFGTDAVRAATVLYTEGSKGIGEWNDKVNDSGYAAKVAADRLDNLKGDVEQLGGAFDTYLIKSGSGANDMLRLLVSGATGLVTAVGGLPQPVLAGGLALGGLVAVIGLAGGAALIAVPKFAAMKTGLSTLGISTGTAAKGVGLLSGGLAVAGIAFAIFAARQATATANTQEFKDSLDPTTGAITEYTRALVAKKLAESGAYGNAMRAAGITQKELTDAVVAGGDALDAVQKKLGAENTFLSFFDGTGIAAGNASSAITDLAGDLDRSGTEFDDQAKAAEGSASSTGTAAEAYQSAADKAGELQSNLSDLIDTINTANGVGQDAISQNIAYQSALADVDAQIAAIAAGTEGYSLGISANTEAGRTNLGMLNDLAGSSQSAAAAQFALDGNTANYKATLEAGRQAVIDRAIALGATKDEANNLADAIYRIPAEKDIKILADTAAAARTIDDFINTYGRLSGTIMYRAILPDLNGVASGNGRMGTFDVGGFTGPGRKYDVAGIVHRKEFVSTAETTAVPENRRALEYMHRGGTIRGYASGGFVGYAAPIQYASSGGGWGGGGSGTTTVHRAGDTWTIVTPDPAAAAQAVWQRQNRKAAV